MNETGHARVWIDSLGRRVEIPTKINKVVPYGPFAQALIESIDSEMIVQASARGLQASAKHKARGCARTSICKAEDAFSLDTEILDESSPDVILDIAACEGLLATSIDAQADEYGVPIIHMVIAAGKLPSAYRTLGKLLGRQDRCEELADYVASIDVTVAQVREKVSAEERKRVYLGGYNQALFGYSRSGVACDVLERLGVVNVCKEIEDFSQKSWGLDSLVSLAPDSIILVNVADEAQVIERVAWKVAFGERSVDACFIDDKKKYIFDRNPLLLMTAGSLLLLKLVFPEEANFDIEAVWNDGPFGFFEI